MFGLEQMKGKETFAVIIYGNGKRSKSDEPEIVNDCIECQPVIPTCGEI
jgi:hypothetical protein